VVVKDSQFDPEWRQEPRYWVKNSSTDDKTELREPAMHRLVSFDGSSRSVVWFRGHRIYENYFLSRLYLEYCPFKTLETLVAKHAKYDLIDEETLDDNGKPMDRIRIPRRALWSFFEDLAEAACVMAHGHNPLDPTANVRDGWETIIHRDLKPPNIFLGLPRTTGERGIPELKCADFGIAVPYNYAHMKNPQGMLDNGTVGWRAPEHSERIGLNNPAHKLSSATNVWGMGRIMLALIELLHKRNNEVNYCEHEGQVQHAPGKEERLEFYGAKLYELIERCLGPGPRDRITATGLLKSIRENLDDDHGGRPAQLEVGDILEYAADIKWAVERKEG
jgi:serine/threonine protein kinase